MSGSVNVSVNVDANRLLDQIGAAGDRHNFNDQSFPDGGRFISVMAGKNIYAAYFHPSKRHQVTVTAGFGGTSAKSIANAGVWAWAEGKAGFMGNKTNYNTL